VLYDSSWLAGADYNDEEETLSMAEETYQDDDDAEDTSQTLNEDQGYYTEEIDPNKLAELIGDQQETGSDIASIQDEEDEDEEED
jgi:hypothetical protein